MNQEEIRQAVKRACTMFEGSDQRWALLRAAGATNQQIRLQIADEFGLGGGDNLMRHDGGTKPKVYSWDHKVCVSGKELVDMVRDIFAIPRAVDGVYQLALFTVDDIRGQ